MGVPRSSYTEAPRFAVATQRWPAADFTIAVKLFSISESITVNVSSASLAGVARWS